MPCLITTLTRSAIKKTTRKVKQKKDQRQKFQGKAQYLKLKALGTNVKMQSHKTLTTHIYFFPNYTADGNFC